MATYLALNIIFMALVLVVLGALKMLRWDTTMTRVLVLLIVLTAVFDSIIIGVGIVDYDYSKTLGLRLGYAPVEDFMYALLALLLVPTIWKKLEARHARKS